MDFWSQTSLPRRSATLGSLCVLLMLAGHSAFAQGGNPAPEGGSAPLGEDALAGKTVLVTGSTDGLGRMLAGQFAAMGAQVIVHGRNAERGEEVVQSIREDGRGDAVFYQADLASLADVRQLAESVRRNHDRLDILVNNAGIWRVGEEQERFTSEDGHELVFHVNYLSHFLLTHELLPLLRAAAPARIVNVASGAQRPLDFDNLMLTEDYSDSRAYGQSKLAQILFTFELAPRVEQDGIAVLSLHPATMMDTTMVQTAGAQPRSTVEEGARAVMQLAVSPELEGRTGLYFSGMQEAQANAQAYDEQARARLWELSMELAGLH